jgi:hypothetical protein
MIIFKETSKETNIIHIIVGPETDFQLDLSGHLVISLDDKLDNTKKNYLFFNRCMTSEEELKNQFDYFATQSDFEKNNNLQNISVDNKNCECQKSTEKNSEIIPSLDEKFENGLKCPKCLTWGTFVKNGIVTMCKTCKEIEIGKEKVTPLSAKEKTLLNKIFNSIKKSDNSRKNDK